MVKLSIKNVPDQDKYDFFLVKRKKKSSIAEHSEYSSVIPDI